MVPVALAEKLRYCVELYEDLMPTETAKESGMAKELVPTTKTMRKGTRSSRFSAIFASVNFVSALDRILRFSTSTKISRTDKLTTVKVS